MKKKNIVYSAKIGILGAVAFLLMLLEFPLPFAPSFYELDFSETAVLISGFALGPVAAVLTELIKVLLNIIFTGTITAGVGEFANFCMGISFVLPAVILYHRKKTLKNAVAGMILGTFMLTVVGALMNYFVMIPAYVTLSHFPLEAIIGMGGEANSNVDSLLTLVLFCVVPFNLLKGVICSAATALIYKRLSPILHKDF